MKKIFLLAILPLLLLNAELSAQDLDEILNGLSDKKSPNYTYGTFKGTTIINGQSVEVTGKSELLFFISHRFGQINQGIYTFFGLDQGTTRFGFEHGINDRISLSIARNNIDKIYDGGLKIAALKQQTGIRNIPVSVSIYTSVHVKTLKWEIPERENLFSSRLSYVSQILIARKFNQKLSLQLSPSFIHKNLVPTPEDQNNIFSIGTGGRYKLGKKFSLNGEYFYVLPGKTADDYANSLSFGFDIEAAGHVFQIHVTNSQPMFARGFITETLGEWAEGEVYLGFNIYRVFPLRKRK
jgi:hypothetical protein